MMLENCKDKIKEIKSSAMQRKTFNKVERIMRKHAKKNGLYIDVVYRDNVIVVVNDIADDGVGSKGNSILNIAVSCDRIKMMLWRYRRDVSATAIMTERRINSDEINKRNILNSYDDMVKEVRGIIQGAWNE